MEKVQTRLDGESVGAVKALAKKERRDVAAMLRVLVEEALEARRAPRQLPWDPAPAIPPGLDRVRGEPATAVYVDEHLVLDAGSSTTTGGPARADEVELHGAPPRAARHQFVQDPMGSAGQCRCKKRRKDTVHG